MTLFIACWAFCCAPSVAIAQLNLQVSVVEPNGFTPAQLEILDVAIAEAEALWESVVLGYQPGIDLEGLIVNVKDQPKVFANAFATSTVAQGGFVLTREGTVNIAPDVVSDFSSWGEDKVNVVDEIIAHEIGHLLGIGLHWESNGVYERRTGEYTGAHGLAAFQMEFDDSAGFVPVELRGMAGTRDKHWDQIMRSDQIEGNPDDPFALSPLLGIVDDHGRDLALELMTGAIDPDFGEPFLSLTTVQSLRDLGYEVVPEPQIRGALLVGLLGVVTASLRRRRQPAARTMNS